MKKSQVWIETVIYTLIGLAIIGIVLGIAKPAIDEKRDEISVSQSIDLLNGIDGKIDEVRYVAGNSRELEIKISRGKLVVDGNKDEIKIIIEDSRYMYSEPGLNVSVGNIRTLTEEKGKKYTINLVLDYDDRLNITYNNKDIAQVFQPSNSPYNLLVRNNGIRGSLTNIDFL